MDGKILQINKKYINLKQGQREKIDKWLHEEFVKLAADYDGKLSKQHRSDIISAVYKKIEACDIWIPYGEVERHFESRISKWTNKLNKEHIPILNEPVTAKIDYVMEIMNSRTIEEIRTNVTAFLEFINENKKIKLKMCNQLIKSVVEFITPYTFPAFTFDRNVTIIPPNHSPIFMLKTCVPYTKNVALIIEGLNKFVKRCDEFREPKNAIISKIEINLVLDVAHRKYKILDIISPFRPLKILLLNNSHFYYNCECGFTDQGENSEAILLIYHPNQMEIYDRVFIFAHELGHALHLALTGDIKIIPDDFDDFNAKLGLISMTLEEKQENFADAVAIAILNSDELKEHLPTELANVLPPYFDKYVTHLTTRHLKLNEDIPF